MFGRRKPTPLGKFLAISGAFRRAGEGAPRRTDEPQEWTRSEFRLGGLERSTLVVRGRRRRGRRI